MPRVAVVLQLAMVHVVTALFLTHHSVPVSASNALPWPTTEVLAWSQQEMGMLVSFDLATYMDHGDGCEPKEVPSAQLFAPLALNTDNWALAMRALGAQYAVLVAKHTCGFTLWPTRSSLNLSDSKVPYNYSVQHSAVPNLDVVASFVQSCQRVGIRTGFYYSAVSNSFLNVQQGVVQNDSLSPGQLLVTQEAYDDLVMEQLTELWTTYGSQGTMRRFAMQCQYHARDAHLYTYVYVCCYVWWYTYVCVCCYVWWYTYVYVRCYV